MRPSAVAAPLPARISARSSGRRAQRLPPWLLGRELLGTQDGSAKRASPRTAEPSRERPPKKRSTRALATGAALLFQASALPLCLPGDVGCVAAREAAQCARQPRRQERQSPARP